MPSYAVAALLYPFVLFVLAVTVLRPARKFVERRLKQGKLKDALLTKNPVVMGTGVFLTYLLLIVAGLLFGGVN